MAKYFLNDDDRKKIGEMYGYYKRANKSDPPRPPTQPRFAGSNKGTTAVARLTSLSAASYASDPVVPGSGSGTLWKLNDGEMEDTEESVTCYSLSTSSFIGQVWVQLAKDKYGTWWVQGVMCGG